MNTIKVYGKTGEHSALSYFRRINADNSNRLNEWNTITNILRHVNGQNSDVSDLSAFPYEFEITFGLKVSAFPYNFEIKF